MIGLIWEIPSSLGEIAESTTWIDGWMGDDEEDDGLTKVGNFAQRGEMRLLNHCSQLLGGHK